MKFDAGAFACESPHLIHNISRSHRKHDDMQTVCYIKTLQLRTAPTPTPHATCPSATSEDALHDRLTMTTCTRKT